MPVPEGLAGMRVDAGLARLLGLSRTAAAAVAEEGGVEIDGVLALETGARRGVADLARLTSREREIVERVVAGKRNQDVAAELSISIKTVEFHRANVMRKMGANSLPDLVQLVSRAGARGRR